MGYNPPVGVSPTDYILNTNPMSKEQYEQLQLQGGNSPFSVLTGRPVNSAYPSISERYSLYPAQQQVIEGKNVVVAGHYFQNDFSDLTGWYNTQNAAKSLLHFDNVGGTSLSDDTGMPWWCGKPGWFSRMEQVAGGKWSGAVAGTNNGARSLQSRGVTDTDFVLGTDDFTIEFFPTIVTDGFGTTGTSSLGFLEITDEGGSNLLDFYLQKVGTQWRVDVTANLSGTNFTVYSTLFDITPGTYFHVAIVRRNLYFYIYIDGVDKTVMAGQPHNNALNFSGTNGILRFVG